MRTAIVYYSETGNTAKVAGAMAAALSAEAPGDETILSSVQDAPQLDDRDLIFVGMPIVRFGAPEAAQRYLAEQCAGRRVALFVTHTAPDYLDQLPGWLDACRQAAAGAELVGLFHCQGVLAEPIRQFMLASGDPMLAQFAEMAACAEGQPDEAALARAADFARETVAREQVARETITSEQVAPAIPAAADARAAAPAAPAL